MVQRANPRASVVVMGPPMVITNSFCFPTALAERGNFCTKVFAAVPQHTHNSTTESPFRVFKTTDKYSYVGIVSVQQLYCLQIVAVGHSAINTTNIDYYRAILG